MRVGMSAASTVGRLADSLAVVKVDQWVVERVDVLADSLVGATVDQWVD